MSVIGAVQVFARVSGVVQGVGYRAGVAREAQRLGLSGWVRNLPDGRVELLAEGDSRAVEALLTWCRRGPALAVVSGIETEQRPPQALRGFEVRR